MLLHKSPPFAISRSAPDVHKATPNCTLVSRPVKPYNSMRAGGKIHYSIIPLSLHKPGSLDFKIEFLLHCHYKNRKSRECTKLKTSLYACSVSSFFEFLAWNNQNIEDSIPVDSSDSGNSSEQ